MNDSMTDKITKLTLLEKGESYNGHLRTGWTFITIYYDCWFPTRNQLLRLILNVILQHQCIDGFVALLRT